MTAPGTPPREWAPAVNDTVVDRRFDGTGLEGIVTGVDRYGHFADPYWIATVRWSNGDVAVLNTVWLARPDGSQGNAANGGGR